LLRRRSAVLEGPLGEMELVPATAVVMGARQGASWLQRNPAVCRYPHANAAGVIKWPKCRLCAAINAGAAVLGPDDRSMTAGALAAVRNRLYRFVSSLLPSDPAIVRRRARAEVTGYHRAPMTYSGRRTAPFLRVDPLRLFVDGSIGRASLPPVSSTQSMLRGIGAITDHQRDRSLMHITMVGRRYVGLVVGRVSPISELCLCVDKDEFKGRRP